jgi:uncharacterized phage protein gp47/JayE
MPISLKNLLTPPTGEVMKQAMADLLSSAGFPVSSWQAFSVGRTLLESEAVALSDLGQLLGQIAAGGFLEYASGGWLDLLGKNLYGLTRKPGLPTKGQLELEDVGGVGPIEIKAGKYKATSGGLIYTNTTGGTLALNGTLTLVWQAEAVGAQYNASNGATFELATTIPGVTLATAPTTPGGSWITQAGIDVESDPAYRTRCRTRWGTLGGGASIDAYTSWALTASDEVATVAVFPHSPLPGQVQIYLAGAGVAVSDDAVAAVEAYLTPARVPVCVEVFVDKANDYSLVIAGTVEVKSTRYLTAKARIQKALQALIASMPIGGTLKSAAIIAAIMGADPGVVDVSLAGGDTDFALDPDQLAVLSLTLSENPGTGLLAIVKV